MSTKGKKRKSSAARDFSSMIVCGQCGEYYGSKVWHSNTKYRKIIYRCNAKYKGEKCSTEAIDEERLKEIFVEAINKLIYNKEEIIDNIRILLEAKSSKTNFANDIKEAAVSLNNIEQEYRQVIETQKTNPVPFDEYELKVKEYSTKYDNAKERYNALIDGNRSHEKKIIQLEQYVQSLESIDGIIKEYDYDLMKRTVEVMMVNIDGTITVRFIGEQEITIKI